jgi:environmental stress-induced protein Ves
MLVLDGALELEMAGAGTLRLDTSSNAAEFPGDADIRALTPVAPVIDLNVMVRRGRFTASLERRQIAGSAAVVCQDTTLILCSTPGEAMTGAESHVLAPGDAIRVDAMRGALARLRLTGEVAIAHVNAVR